MTTAPEWITRNVSRLRGVRPATDAAPSTATTKPEAERSTHERLQATLRRGSEALTPRALRRLLADLQEVVAPRVSEIEGGNRAQAVATWYAQAEPGERRDMWLLMSEQFAPDATRFKSARVRYEAAAGTDEQGQAEISLRRALVSPRTRLLQRFSVFPQGMRFLVDLRAELLRALKGDKRLLALDAELEHLFSTWFDVAFLELRRLSWDSPASLLEKLIQYEAVHDIRSWADLKNRLDSDRRCYGFFHPRLPNEPLIFVEVALVESISGSITPLLDEAAAPIDIGKATTAIFYSISNTQSGLRGVSFGDSLIKHVVETLQQEFPRLRTFATLSPIPGLRAWLGKNAGAMIERLDERRRNELGRAVGMDSPQAAHLLDAADKGRRPLGQGPQAVVRNDGQLPLRPQAHRQAPQPAGRGQGGRIARNRKSERLPLNGRWGGGEGNHGNSSNRSSGGAGRCRGRRCRPGAGHCTQQRAAQRHVAAHVAPVAQRFSGHPAGRWGALRAHRRGGRRFLRGRRHFGIPGLSLRPGAAA